jgi:predicted O-methyltransferase YrrM
MMDKNEILREGGIGPEMAAFLDSICSKWNFTRSVEIGVAGGSGSEVILRYSKNHHGIDTSREFYRDKRFLTGELVLDNENFTLHIGNLADVASNLPTFNFVYIDADHRHPLPSIDLFELAKKDFWNTPFF